METDKIHFCKGRSGVFKSYYVVWKLYPRSHRIVLFLRLNRTM